MDDSIKPNFSASHKGHFQKAQNFVVFFRSQTHSYAYHLVSVRRHNQHVRSPIQGFFRCEGISFIPRVKQRSTFPRLSPQERMYYITSHRPASIAAPRSNWRGRSDPHPLLKTTFLKQRFFGARANSPVYSFSIALKQLYQQRKTRVS